MNNYLLCARWQRYTIWQCEWSCSLQESHLGPKWRWWERWWVEVQFGPLAIDAVWEGNVGTHIIKVYEIVRNARRDRIRGDYLDLTQTRLLLSFTLLDFTLICVFVISFGFDATSGWWLQKIIISKMRWCKKNKTYLDWNLKRLFTFYISPLIGS